jgi:hypothetical protein
MRPWLWPGGTLRVERCASRLLRVGDIAVWFDGSRLLAHRVVSVRGEAITTQADLRERADSPVLARQVIGRAVCFHYHGLSYRVDQHWMARLAPSLRWAARTWGKLRRRP